MDDYLIKSKSKTNPDYGCDPYERPIEEHISKGVINLDKPSGPSSHEVDSWVKRILHVNKTGHGGTLDPKVTGVLPIGIDTATRVSQLLLPAGKEYVCLMTMHKEMPEDQVYEIFDQFTGKIYQTPPVKSAVKRELRVRTIYYATIYEIKGKDVLFRVGCEAGTYIRTLCHDIGEALGCGAHMAELRRTRAGPFNERNDDLVNLHDLTDAYHFWVEDGDESYLRNAIKPMEVAADHLPQIFIKDSAVEAICQGAKLAAGGISMLSKGIKRGDLVAIKSLKGELVASGIALASTEEIMNADSGLVVNTNKVFMQPGVYPMAWK
ncbi:MAG: RNA-guided pseudouridylation complex pseudouridine synthase subunit Cbf5 [Methanobrevibacter sp.]|jgi:H/ACA ribonucleoprotein complex subunit 4|nr:RNA-guided pseudouridylation complex pseudouridine synthase subunit Cbf5 [Methanobrevibacter sp.]